jgi:glycosyltransferase involved in cell wall biosynthesis
MSTEGIQVPSISVVVPAFNAALHLNRCLEAVFANNGIRECIVVDDGSTDDSASIARQFGARVLHLSHGPFGPAYARNRGAEAALGAIIFFVDADVVLGAGASERVLTVFREHANLAAVFGSYDAHPAASGMISQYRNLLHHFVHQNGNTEASTFWAGCGAIRHRVFMRIGGFDEKRFSRPSIEDIELGYRLRSAGYRILLDKQLQGTHLKRWSFLSLIRTDIICRAVPWSRLIHETTKVPQELNLVPAQKASVALMGSACVFVALGLVWQGLFALSALALSGVIFLNRRLYAFFWRERGISFAISCIPLHLFYNLYSGLSYFYVSAEFQIKKLTKVRPASKLKSASQTITVKKT